MRYTIRVEIKDEKDNVFCSDEVYFNTPEDGERYSQMDEKMWVLGRLNIDDDRMKNKILQQCKMHYGVGSKCYVRGRGR